MWKCTFAENIRIFYFYEFQHGTDRSFNKISTQLLHRLFSQSIFTDIWCNIEWMSSETRWMWPPKVQIFDVFSEYLNLWRSLSHKNESNLENKRSTLWGAPDSFKNVWAGKNCCECFSNLGAKVERCIPGILGGSVRQPFQRVESPMGSYM